MTNPAPPAAPNGFLARLRSGGIEPGDDPDKRLAKSLLILATGLISLAAIFWVAIYWVLGPAFSSTIPILFQLMLVGNLLLFIATRNFAFFSVSQLALLLFLPFVAQWMIGNIIDSSGIALWGVLAPVGALLCFGVSQSAGWFIAWVALMALSGAADFYVADMRVITRPVVPPTTSIAFFTLNFIGVAGITYALLRSATIERRKAQKALESAHISLLEEQARSENLLLNILPAPVAARLKHSEQTIADGFPDATVMFADIVNFTQVAGSMTPVKVFEMLNRIFSAFDELADRYQLEKIKTIGDAYMIAGGVVGSRADYTAAIADLATEMRDLLHRDFTVNFEHLDIRIGIATGPVVAGVVGRRKFIYDLWGDTVNIASRVTSEGAPGSILCDEATFDRLKARFVFHDAQTLFLKGKGNMAVHRLAGRLAG